MPALPVTISFKHADYIIKWEHLACLSEEFFGHVVETAPPDDTLFTIEFSGDDSTAHSKAFKLTLDGGFTRRT